MNQTFNIIAPHKCGTTVLFNNILADESERYYATKPEPGSNQKPLTGPLIEDSSKVKTLDNIFIFKLPGIDNTSSRVTINATRNLEWLQSCNSQDKMIFILRNPISITISAFYSYNYTHPMDGMHPKQREDRYINRELGLHGYVMKYINFHAWKIQQLWNHPNEHKLILPYELMITKFDVFLRRLLLYMNMGSLYDDIYSKHFDKFIPGPDLTDQIVDNNLKAHKRTSNINEWREKIPQNLIDTMCNNHPIISTYQNFLDEQLQTS